MKRKKGGDYTVQMYDDAWYLDKFNRHECCVCGAEHEVERKVEEGKIFTRWKLDKRATTVNQKRHGITVTRKDPA
jgi:hypothetical protein